MGERQPEKNYIPKGNYCLEIKIVYQILQQDIEEHFAPRYSPNVHTCTVTTKKTNIVSQANKNI